MTYKLEVYDANGQLKSGGSGSGEVNTASNQGVGGVGVYIQKTGVDLEFKNLNVGSNKVTVTDDPTNKEIDIDITETNIVHNSLSGLTTGDPHTQYAFLAGRSGGQTLYGGTGSGDDLIIGSTSHVTKGDIRILDFTQTGRLYINSVVDNGVLAIHQDGYDKAIDPTVDYDVDGGWVVGSEYENTTTYRVWRCLDNTDGAAVWREITHPMTTAGDVLYFNGTLLTRLAIGTADQVLTVNAGATAPEWQAASGGGNSFAIIRDEKATTTDGGGAGITTWNARDLNTELVDADNIVTIGSNQFTPIAGTYRLRASAPANDVDGHRLRLYNVTGTAVVEEGQNENAASGGNLRNMAHLECPFTANGTDAYRIDHYTTTAKATSGLGEAVSDGSNEVYLSIYLEKVG